MYIYIHIYIYTTFSVAIYILSDIWVVYILSLLWMYCNENGRTDNSYPNFYSFEYKPQSEIIRSHGSYVFNFLVNLPSVSTVVAPFYSYQQLRSIPISQVLHILGNPCLFTYLFWFCF